MCSPSTRRASRLGAFAWLLLISCIAPPRVIEGLATVSRLRVPQAPIGARLAAAVVRRPLLFHICALTEGAAESSVSEDSGSSNAAAAPSRDLARVRSDGAPVGTGSRAVIFTIMSAFAIAVSYADRSNLSTAIVQMTSQFHWDNLFSGVVLSAFWGGYALTQVVGGRLADRVGGEKILAGALVLWSLCTFATPLAASTSSGALIATRVLLGAGEGLALPSIHSMLQKYVDPKQRATSASVITAACYLGALVSNYLSPILIGKWNWQACFYIFAAIPPLLWLPIWLSKFVFNNDAISASATTASSDSSPVSKYDVNKFSLGGGRASLRALLKSPQIWAIVAAQYGQSWGMIGLLSWLPTYYSQRFNVPIAELGYFTTLPYLLQMIVAVVAGNVADGLINSGTKTIEVRRLLQTIGMLVPAACLAYCSLSADLSAASTAAIITLGSAASAMTVGAVSCNHFDIAPKNAGMVFGIGNTASCIGGLVAVPISGYIYDQTNSWDSVFLLFTAHYIVGAVVYYFLSSDQPIAADI